MFDNPDTDLYYCRMIVITTEKRKVRIRVKMSKGNWIYKHKMKNELVKSECNTQMKYVPAHKDGGQFYANYIYCPKHNNKVVLGY